MLYRRTRTRLIEELGVEPSAELVGIQRAILRRDQSLARSPPARRGATVPSTGRRARSTAPGYAGESHQGGEFPWAAWPRPPGQDLAAAFTTRGCR
ncbi:hypothetical protein J7E88_12155 [Streptomyces sp. ISL-10]|nr:hypothetical protein [Streptomyces sp. ISL-10]